MEPVGFVKGKKKRLVTEGSVCFICEKATGKLRAGSSDGKERLKDVVRQ